MDPTACILSIIDASLKITKYIKDISHGGKERQLLSREILSVYQVFLGIQDQFTSEGWATDTAWIRSTRPLIESGGTIDQLQLTLDEVSKKLTVVPQDHLARSKRALKWPFDKDESRSVIDRIEHHKSLINVAIGQANLELGKESNTNISYMKDVMDNKAFFNTLDRISPLDFRELQQSPLRRPVAGTGRWFLKDDRFQGWAAGRVPIIWCHGIPGAGKTVLASAASSHMLQQEMDQKASLIAFCASTHTTEDILSSLLRQMIQSRNQLSEPIRKLYNDHATGKKQGRPNLEQICEALNSELEKLDETFVILDGLDEMSDQLDRAKLMRSLEALKPRPKVMVASRSLPDIRAWFSTSAHEDGFRIDENERDHSYRNGCDRCYESSEPKVANYECASCQHNFCNSCYDAIADGCPRCGKDKSNISWLLTKAITIAAQPQDIERYIDWRIDTSKALQNIVAKIASRDLRQMIITRVLEGAKQMFLLAKLHMDVLVKQPTARLIEHALETLPKGITDAYDRIFRIIDSDTTAALVHKFIAIIARAKSLLNVAALEDAIAVQPGDTELDEMNKCDLKHLASLCAGLVDVDRFGFVRFAHETVGEYVDQHSHQTFRESESLLAETCLTYLGLSVFGNSESQQGDSLSALERKKKDFLFLSYAAKYWGIHARGAKQSRIVDLTLRFLSKERHVQTAVQVMRQNHGAGDLHFAAYYGLTQAVSQLIGNGAEPDPRDCLNTTPLMYAATAGEPGIVALLLEAGADPGLICGKGCTALHRALQNRHIPVVRRLVLSDKNIAVNAFDALFSYQSPLTFAVGMECNEVVKLLLSRRDIHVNAVRPDHFGQNALHRAVIRGANSALEALLLYPDIDIEATDAAGRTPLILAAEVGREKIVKILLDRGAQLEARARYGGTALYFANSVDCVRTLIKRGADYRLKNFLGRNILHTSANNGRASTLRYLLSVVDGLDPNNRGHRGETPLQEAVYHDYSECVQLLLSSGARTDILDNAGRSPVRVAQERGSRKSFTLLREARLQEIERDRAAARVNGMPPDDIEFGMPKRCDTSDSDYKMPIHSAVRLLDEEALQIYLGSLGEKLEVSVNMIDNDMLQTPLHIAAYYGKNKTVSFLLTNGAHPNVQDMWDSTPLHCVAERGHTEIVSQLLDHGADIDVLDAQKCSPLDSALQPRMALLLTKRGASFGKSPRNLLWLLFQGTQHGELEVVKHLVAAGVPFQLNAEDGLTAYLRARLNNHTDVADFLFEEGERQNRTKTHVSGKVTAEQPTIEIDGKSAGCDDYHQRTCFVSTDGRTRSVETDSAVADLGSVVKGLPAIEVRGDHTLNMASEMGELTERREDQISDPEFLCRLGLTGRESALVGVIVFLVVLLLVR